MHLLIANGGQRRDHHVEAVEPRPAFDEVISRGADRHDKQQQSANDPQIAQGFHSRYRWRSLAVCRSPQRAATDFGSAAREMASDTHEL